MAHIVLGCTVPAGRYFLGDPCYAVPEGLWEEFCAGIGDTTHPGTVAVGGHFVYAFGTAHGDGAYRGSDGFEYGVDAGLIGLVPEALVDVYSSDGLGTWVTLERETTIVVDSDFLMQFGDIWIPTGDEEEEEEDPYSDADPGL